MAYKYTNHLGNETSPYLQQHAHNPVNWYPWGEEALNKAKEENKPILVSIGYSACHWCHVMERESFEDEATAEIMNRHFINIKIDREERPDLDNIYMDAVQAMTGSGGWPLNVFLTPGGKPFFGGTYFPPQRAYNRPSWKEVLTGISKSYEEKKHEIDSQAENLTAHLEQSNDFSKLLKGDADDLVSVANATGIFDSLMESADKEWGGFGRAPKF
ncbi:MAG TPA: thioredoxin domain-containing protein, partial [Chitinophagaceae bacterium]|nr:thioredoxin domain-containing protein [Chitinophagaceae bacterium]